jgi:hypothetical protein
VQGDGKGWRGFGATHRVVGILQRGEEVQQRVETVAEHQVGAQHEALPAAPHNRPRRRRGRRSGRELGVVEELKSAFVVCRHVPVELDNLQGERTNGRSAVEETNPPSVCSNIHKDKKASNYLNRIHRERISLRVTTSSVHFC